ncbi:MAG: hypothetical protein ACQERB_11525 [Promethearchaeati archaeon]
MSDKYSELLDKIHDKKGKIPVYLTITIRTGKKKDILDIKIKKEKSNILKVLAHEKDQKGWYLHSYHIPLKNLGLPEDAKNKEILPYLTKPETILSDKYTKELIQEILQKYIEIHAERKKHFFRTERFKVKKDFSMGTKKKGF